MSELTLFKKALIGSTALLGGSLLAPAAALATNCPVMINGSVLAGVICSFNGNPPNGSSVTIENGGILGKLQMGNNYQPTDSFIRINTGGTISNTGDVGIEVSERSSLSGGITNNGTISAQTGIGISSNSAVSGGITNNGTITSGGSGIAVATSSVTGGITNSGTINSNTTGIVIVDNSTINGGITNSGHITSTNATGIRITTSTINGGITNSGTISGGSVDSGISILANSTIAGGILNTNSGTIQSTGGNAIDINQSNITDGITNNGTISSTSGNGIYVSNVSNIVGNIDNSGTLTGGQNGISLRSSSAIAGSIINETGGRISGSNNGIFVSSSTITGGIVNGANATISGGATGILVSSSTITGGIQNRGTIQGDVFAINISSSTANNIDLYGGSRVIGTIEAPNTDVNILGNFTTEGTMDVNAVNIDSGAVLNMVNTLTAANGVNNAGTLAVGTTLQTIAGNYTQSTGGILKIGVQNTTTYGQLAVTGTADLSQSGSINVNLLNGYHIAVGNVLTNVISGVTLTAPTDGFNVTDNSRFLNFTAALNGSNTGVDLTAVSDESNSVSHSNAATGNNGGAGAARKLDEMIALSPVGDWQNVIGALNTLNTDQQITAAVNQTVPVSTGATNAALIETMSTASQIVQARQEANSGLSSGEDFETNHNFWAKTFGSWSNQGNDNGVVGYDSKAYGIIGGVDKAITDKARLGVGVSYFNSKLGSNDGYNRVNVDSYLGMVYGSYSLDDRTDVNAQVEAGYNSSDSTRDINFGGLNRIANGSYSGWDLHAGTGIGRIMGLGSDTTITPQARLDYFAVGNESYNESGAGVLSLHVDSQTQDQLIPALQVKVNHNFTPELSLALNAGLGYDLLNERNTVSSSFAGGGVFVTRGLESSPLAIRSGAGLTWKQSDALDLTARYDREDRGSNYDNQTVSLKLRLPF